MSRDGILISQLSRSRDLVTSMTRECRAVPLLLPITNHPWSLPSFSQRAHRVHDSGDLAPEFKKVHARYLSKYLSASRVVSFQEKRFSQLYLSRRRDRRELDGPERYLSTFRPLFLAINSDSALLTSEARDDTVRQGRWL